VAFEQERRKFLHHTYQRVHPSGNSTDLRRLLQTQSCQVLDQIESIYFTPLRLDLITLLQLLCHIANVDKQLELIVSGSCITLPPPKGTINFACPVREYEQKNITISNPYHFRVYFSLL
jgi:hypothetical protein